LRVSDVSREGGLSGRYSCLFIFGEKLV